MQNIEPNIETATQQRLNEAKANTQANPRCGESWKTLGIIFKEVGDNTEALKALRKASMLLPKDLEIFHQLANILLLEKNYGQALGYFKYLTSQAPENALYWHNLGLAYLEDKQPKLAIECFQKAITQNPNFFNAYSNLAKIYKKENSNKEFRNTLIKMEKLPPKSEQEWADLAHQWIDSKFIKEGLNAFKKLVEINPDNDFIPYLKGMFAFKNGDIKQTISLFQQAIEKLPKEPRLAIKLAIIINVNNNDIETAIKILKKAEKNIPNNSEILRQLCVLLYNSKKNKEIIDYLEKLVELEPDAKTFKMIGHYKHTIGEHKKAISAFEQGMAMQTDDIENEVTSNYTSSLILNNETHKAIKKIKEAIAKQPNNEIFIGLLSQALYKIGEIDKSITNSKKIIYKKPYNKVNLSNYLFTIIHSSKFNIQSLFKEHKKFSRFFEDSIKPFTKHSNNPDPNRKLKIGFVSGDMYKHAIAYFAIPLFESLDKNQFELSVFYTYTIKDILTQDLKKLVSNWFDVAEMEDYELAKFIKDQEIDILIDLSGHTGHNRLPSFAYKPAPIQITTMGYPYTTGLKAMDYTLTSEFISDLSYQQKFWTEKFIIAPKKTLKTRPIRRQEATQPMNEPAVKRNGFFTYASLNRFSKINDEVLSAWVKILQLNPNSKILLGNVEKGNEQDIIDFFAKNNISADRLILKPRLNITKYMALFNEIDLMLDTWPYGGGTTANDALSMGVPIIVIKSHHPVQARSNARLRSMGLEQLIANNTEDYINAAVAWAEQLEELQAIRLDLINRPELSKEERQTNTAWNKALRMAWQRWCAGLPVESFRIPE